VFVGSVHQPLRSQQPVPGRVTGTEGLSEFMGSVHQGSRTKDGRVRVRVRRPEKKAEGLRVFVDSVHNAFRKKGGRKAQSEAESESEGPRKKLRACVGLRVAYVRRSALDGCTARRTFRQCCLGHD